MAEKKTPTERKYIIPLRKEFNKVPSYQKSSKATKAIRNFIAKHMKVNEVKIANSVNLEIWKHGRKNPPSKIEVKTIIEENFARVQLPHLDFEKKKEKKAKKAEGLKGKLQEKVGSLKGEDKKPKEKTEEKGEETKKKTEVIEKKEKQVTKTPTKTAKQPKITRSY